MFRKPHQQLIQTESPDLVLLYSKHGSIFGYTNAGKDVFYQNFDWQITPATKNGKVVSEQATIRRNEGSNPNIRIFRDIHGQHEIHIPKKGTILPTLKLDKKKLSTITPDNQKGNFTSASEMNTSITNDLKPLKDNGYIFGYTAGHKTGTFCFSELTEGKKQPTLKVWRKEHSDLNTRIFKDKDGKKEIKVPQGKKVTLKVRGLVQGKHTEDYLESLSRSDEDRSLL